MNLFEHAEVKQRRARKDKDELLKHCALVLSKALKHIDRGRVGENIVRKEIKETIKALRAA